MPDDHTRITGPAITVAGSRVVTLEQLRIAAGVTRRRALVDQINNLGHPVAATNTIRNVEGGHQAPGDGLLTAWLRSLDQDPNQEVVFHHRNGTRSVIRRHAAQALAAVA